MRNVWQNSIRVDLYITKALPSWAPIFQYYRSSSHEQQWLKKIWKHFLICFVCLMRYKRTHVTWQWRVLRNLFCLFLTLKGKYFGWIIFIAPSSYFFRFFGIFSNFDMRLLLRLFLLLWWWNIFFIRQVQEIKPTGKMNNIQQCKRTELYVIGFQKQSEQHPIIN